MQIIELIKTLVAPTAVAALVALVAVVLLLRYLADWRSQLLRSVSAEVQRDLTAGAPEVRVQSPVVTSADDPYVKTSVCDLHHKQWEGRLGDLSGRVERLERKLDQDITRLHERIDELPQRMVELIKPLL